MEKNLKPGNRELFWRSGRCCRSPSTSCHYNAEKITPNINAGDVVIMNSCLWHESEKNISDIDRVMFDIIIQPSNDPSGSQLICGDWETNFWIGRKEDHTFQIDSLFINSRIKKLKKYENNK